MWAGGSSGTGDGFPQPWAHGSGPTASFMTMPPEQVDWASLAQQWIKMKESTADPSKEGGEAPMDITKDDRNADWPGGQEAWNAGNWAWEQGGGAWMNWAAAAVPKAPVVPAFPTAGYTTIPEPPAPHAPPAPIYSYVPAQNAPPVAATTASSPDFTRDYWPSNSTSDGKSLIDSNHSRKRNSSTSSIEPPAELDAAKRKKLPAWIREGLEKMEREKQKRAEQERLERLKMEEREVRGRTPDPPVISMGQPLNGPTEALKSKFESDSESSSDTGLVADNDNKAQEEPTKRWSRFDSNDAPPPSTKPPIQPMSRPPVKSFRSKEQILQAVMTDVRRVITQVLLEVTNEEIEKAVEEVDKKFKRKAPATTIRKTPALTSLTGKLGLGVYESDSGSDSESEKVTNEPDSDEEIQERIERLKNEFVSVEMQIEKEAQEQEEREKRQLVKSVSRGDESQSDAEEQVQPPDEGTQVKFIGGAHTSHEIVRPNETHVSKNYDWSKSRNSRHGSSNSSSTDSSSTSTSSSSSSSTSEESASRQATTASSSKRRTYQRSDRRSSRYKRSRSWSRSSRTRSRSRSRERRSDKRKRSSSRKRRRRSSDRRRRRSSSSSSGGRYSAGRRSGHRR